MIGTILMLILPKHYAENLQEVDRKKSRGKKYEVPHWEQSQHFPQAEENIFACVQFHGEKFKSEIRCNKITISLNKLWEEVRVNGHNNVSMAVLGSDRARMSASHSNFIKTHRGIFYLASRESIVTKN